VGTIVLRADRRFKCSHVYDVAAGAGDLFDLRSRFESGEVGKRRDSANIERFLAGYSASGGEDKRYESRPNKTQAQSGRYSQFGSELAPGSDKLRIRNLICALGAFV